jgi:hypothetical protein
MFVISLILGVAVLWLVLKSLRSSVKDKKDVVQDGIVCDGSYTVHYKKWGWTNCPENRQEAGTYWTNRVDGRTFYLGITTSNAIGTYGSPCPKTYIKEVTQRPPKGTCAEVK